MVGYYLTLISLDLTVIASDIDFGIYRMSLS